MSTTASSSPSGQEEEVPLPKTDSFFETKTFRLLTLGLYMAGVSGMGMTLAMYYLFIWDSRMPPLPEFKHTHHIAIRLLNTSEVTAEQFYKNILEQYRILNHMQQQRQQFLQKQHLQLQQLSATNKFQEVFATATIIQANRNEHYKKLTTTNGTLLLEPRSPMTAIEEQQQQQQQQQQLQLQQQQEQHMAPILDTTTTHIKRKSHRKHYNHHRHNIRKNYRKLQANNNNNNNNNNPEVTEQQQQRFIENTEIIEPATAVMEQNHFTPIPIPLILNTREEKRPHHHEHSTKMSALQPRRRTSAAQAAVGIYERPTYMNPFLTGELIFEK